MTKLKIGAIILSAGASTRMTHYKQLLQYQGASLLKRLFSHLQTLDLSDVVCVTGELHDELVELSSSDNVSFIRNEFYKKGMLSTIQVGLSKLKKDETIDAVLICLSDQPLIPVKHYQDLLNSASSSEKTIICSSYNETFGPPLVFKRPHFKEILELEGKSAKPFIKQNKTRVEFIHCKEAGVDIDTDEDYKKLINADGE